MIGSYSEPIFDSRVILEKNTLYPFFINCQIDNCSGCKPSSITENNRPTYKCKNNCDPESECNCDKDKCRPNLYNTNDICYFCDGLSSSKSYTITNGSSECNKITYENNECVNNCGDGYELGDFCFYACYEYLGLENGIITSTSKTCKCKEFYIEIKINNKIFFQCVDSCPYYYDAITKKCVDKCKGTTNRITNNKGCKEECNDSACPSNCTL